MSANQVIRQTGQTGGYTTNSARSTYVIQRSSETVREWWTGHHWTDDLNRARRYAEEPDACVVSEDEMAKAIKLSEIDD